MLTSECSLLIVSKVYYHMPMDVVVVKCAIEKSILTVIQDLAYQIAKR